MLMASATLRSRKTEGLKTRSSGRNTAILPGNNDLNIGRMQPPNIGRRKRHREDIEDEEIQSKRARFAIELSPKKPISRTATRSLIVTSNAVLEPKQRRARHYPNDHAKSNAKTIPKATNLPEISTALKKPTKHHDKVVNGIKHELDRLKPAVGPALDTGTLLKEERRILRSQENTKFKSELSAYFPEYDEVIGNEPKEEHILNFETPIAIIDSTKPHAKNQPSLDQHLDCLIKQIPSPHFCNFNDSQRVDFALLYQNYTGDNGGEDILVNAHFESIHKKPERAEKAIRNTDKGRAQHEKDQVIRLLEGLQGPEWLKLMGVSGITDSKKKEYEPAREHFIRGCQTIISKFKYWKEEEKKRKLEKEAALAEVEEEEEEEEEEEADIVMGEQAYMDEDDAGASEISDGDPPDYSDIDASAARQLHEEAIARSASNRPGRKRMTRPLTRVDDDKEVKSFFKKPHLRAKALGSSRRSGRSAAALGHPIPDVEPVDFELPAEFRDEETLRTRERRKRRDRRISKN